MPDLQRYRSDRTGALRRGRRSPIVRSGTLIWWRRCWADAHGGGDGGSRHRWDGACPRVLRGRRHLRRRLRPPPGRLAREGAGGLSGDDGRPDRGRGEGRPPDKGAGRRHRAADPLAHGRPVRIRRVRRLRAPALRSRRPVRASRNLAARPAANYLGISADELRRALFSGSTPARLAIADGRSGSGIERAMLAPLRERLAAGVTAGRRTNDRSARILADVTAASTASSGTGSRTISTPSTPGARRGVSGLPAARVQARGRPRRLERQ
jgi:hypothetical protein